jgi:hypothetical protein
LSQNKNHPVHPPTRYINTASLPQSSVGQPVPRSQVDNKSSSPQRKDKIKSPYLSSSARKNSYPLSSSYWKTIGKSKSIVTPKKGSKRDVTKTSDPIKQVGGVSAPVGTSDTRSSAISFLAENGVFRNQISPNATSSSLKELLEKQRQSYPIQHILQNVEFPATNEKKSESRPSSVSKEKLDPSNGKPPLYPYFSTNSNLQPSVAQAISTANVALEDSRTGRKKGSAKKSKKKRTNSFLSNLKVIYRPVSSPPTTFGVSSRF